MSTWRPLFKGAATMIPGVYALFHQRGAYGSDSAAYCYSVFMRHWIRTSEVQAPDLTAVAELGPGGSLGVGLCALLSGAGRYVALDTEPLLSAEADLRILDALVVLFQERAAVPVGPPHHGVRPEIRDAAFPSSLEAGLAAALDPARIQQIREELKHPSDARNELLRYVAPWTEAEVVEAGSISYAWSQAVLEHVNDLPATQTSLQRWLRPGALASHTIDYSDHGITGVWNGHWQYEPLAWRVVVGARPYLLNREPHSVHLVNAREAGFEVLLEERTRSTGGLGRGEVASRYRNLPDADLQTSGSFLVLRRA